MNRFSRNQIHTVQFENDWFVEEKINIYERAMKLN